MIRLQNEFTVDAPPAVAWPVLIDMQRVAPCLPGATLTGVVDDVFSGAVEVKVGPIRARFEGTARFADFDHEGYRATLVASGKDQRGRSAAEATVTASVVEHDGGSRVLVDTDLEISGRLAQFGRGALADVSAGVLRTFAENLDAQLRIDAQLPTPTPVAGAELSLVPVLRQVLVARFVPVIAAAGALVVGYLWGRRTPQTNTEGVR